MMTIEWVNEVIAYLRQMTTTNRRFLAALEKGEQTVMMKGEDITANTAKSLREDIEKDGEIIDNLVELRASLVQ